ncbi:MAG: hypothetical protein ABIP97_13940, partial [Chthoniobacterales bacterium]
MVKIYVLLLFLVPVPCLSAQDNPEPKKSSRAGVFTNAISAVPLLGSHPKPGVLHPEDLADFEKNPIAVQTLIRKALPLAEQELSYQMGSDDPASGGMDCSGTIYYILQQSGLADVPRSSDEQYRWVWQE